MWFVPNGDAPSRGSWGASAGRRDSLFASRRKPRSSGGNSDSGCVSTNGFRHQSLFFGVLVPCRLTPTRTATRRTATAMRTTTSTTKTRMTRMRLLRARRTGQLSRHKACSAGPATRLFAIWGRQGGRRQAYPRHYVLCPPGEASQCCLAAELASPLDCKNPSVILPPPHFAQPTRLRLLKLDPSQRTVPSQRAIPAKLTLTKMELGLIDGHAVETDPDASVPRLLGHWWVRTIPGGKIATVG